MAVSTAPAAKANLLAQLEARSGLAGVGFKWSAPVDRAQYAPSGEDIFLGDVRQNQDYKVVGAGGALLSTVPTKDEDYTFFLWVQVHRQGDDPQGTETRCWQLVGEVETQLREDPRLNGAFPAQGKAQVSAVDPLTTRPAEPQGWLSKARIHIAVDARI